MFTALAIEDPKFTDENWRQFFDLHVDMRRRYNINFSSRTWQELKKKHVTLQNIDEISDCLAIMHHDKPVGWLDFFGTNQGTPEERFHVSLNACFDEFPEELIYRMAGWCREFLRRYDSDKAFGTSNDRRVDAVFQAWQARRLSRFDEYVLYRDKADTAIMRKWIDEISGANGDLRLEFYEELPDHLIAGFAAILTETLGDMPEERESDMVFHVTPEQIKKFQKWRRENETPAFCYSLHDPGGKIVAFTVAEVRRSNPELIYQHMTGVTEDYRGRGLSKWLKAVMFFKMGELFPENKRIMTFMRAINEPIQRVNAAIGYKIERGGYEYQLTAAMLDNFLKR